MSNCSYRLRVRAAALTVLFVAGGIAPLTLAATASDSPRSEPERQPAKPMIKKEPMAGEMKKDGMMKEDVSKAAQKWDAKMNAAMERDKMK